MPRREGLERIYIEVPKDEGFKEKLKEIAKSHRRSLFKGKKKARV